MLKDTVYRGISAVSYNHSHAHTHTYSHLSSVLCAFNKPWTQRKNEKSCTWMSWMWLLVILRNTQLSFSSVLQLSTRFTSWSTMTALSFCFHHFTASGALLRNHINCISLQFWIIDSVRNREMQGTALHGLVVYSECVWKIIWQSHSNVHTEGFILFILSVFVFTDLSIYLWF